MLYSNVCSIVRDDVDHSAEAKRASHRESHRQSETHEDSFDEVEDDFGDMGTCTALYPFDGLLSTTF